jgi:hypothetical protein
MDDLTDNWVPNNEQDDEEIQAKQIFDNLKGLIRPSATSQNLKSDTVQVQNEAMNSQVRNAFLCLIFYPLFLYFNVTNTHMYL